jgi:hypothetical protein
MVSFFLRVDASAEGSPVINQVYIGLRFQLHEFDKLNYCGLSAGVFALHRNISVSMSNSVSSNICIYISLDQDNLKDYFNPHDPGPLYKRQLSHAFELYILNSIVSVKRYSLLSYKICSRSEEDKQYSEPLIYAIRRHFSEKKAVRQAEFEKFKRRSYLLLFFSLLVVMICQWFLPFLLTGVHQIGSGLSNTLDIFGWVILWRPIDQLIFCWNPYLKDISIMSRLATGEVTLIDNA